MTMPFKKLHSHIQEKLVFFNITEPTPFQTASIPIIKSGTNVYCTAPKDSGKTTTLVLTTLQKLKCEASGNAPRAVILVENKERAMELYELFLAYTKYNSLRVYVGHEQLHIDIQKSEIFEGTDILISTPKTMNKLFLITAILGLHSLSFVQIAVGTSNPENSAAFEVYSTTKGFLPPRMSQVQLTSISSPIFINSDGCLTLFQAMSVI